MNTSRIECGFIKESDFENVSPMEMKYKLIKDFNHLKTTAQKLQCPISNLVVYMGSLGQEYFDKYELCYLDVKVRNLKEGDSGDHLNQIHTDYVKDYNHPNKPETHLLYTNTGRTKFFDLVDGEYKLIGETEPNSIYKYNREYHQSPIVEKACKRLMIRLSYCDRLK